MRNLLALLLFVPSLCLAQVPDYVPLDGLVGWYPFNGNTENLAGEDGTLATTSTDWTMDRDGIDSSAIAFTALNSYAFGSLPADFQNNHYSYALWWRIDGAYNYNGYNLLTYPSSSPGNLDDNALAYTIGENWYYLNCPDATSGYASSARIGYDHTLRALDCAVLEDMEQWNHSVVTVDGTMMKLYFNGTFIDSVSVDLDMSDYLGETLVVGARNNPAQNSLTTRILDEVGIWNRALSEAEVQALFLGTPPEYGCTDSSACNYDTTATEDDGSCVLPPDVDLGPDILSCTGTAVLSVPEEEADYTWSTEESSASIIVAEPGSYSVTAILNSPEPEVDGFQFLFTSHNLDHFLSNSTATWSEASLMCQQNGGNLVSIPDEATNSMLGMIDVQDAWIGLHQDDDNAPWQWTDGSDFDFQNWRSDQPSGADQHCVLFWPESSPSGAPDAQNIWTDETCMDVHHFLMAKPTASYSCQASDTITVHILDAPNLDLGDAIALCGDGGALDAGPGFSSYAWSTGADTQMINVFEEGEYSVTTTFGGAPPNVSSVELGGTGGALESAIQTTDSLTDATWMGWFWFDDLDAPQGLLAQNSGYNTNGYYINTNPFFDTTSTGGSSNSAIWFSSPVGSTSQNAQSWTQADAILPMTWHHIAVVLENGLVQIHVDGIAATMHNSFNEWHLASYDVDQHVVEVSDAPFRLGSGTDISGNVDQVMRGKMDGISLWNRALTQDEIQGYMNCPPSAASTGIQALWTFEPPSPLEDQSGQGHVATLASGQIVSDTPVSICPSCTTQDTVLVVHMNCEGLCGAGTEWSPELGTCVSICEEPDGQCGEGTVWDSTLQQCVSIAPPCAPSCGEGTIWDPLNEECIIAIPADLNYDGCVTVGDLLELLAVHGTCPPYPEWPDEPTDTTWACGDPVTHWGYDYATVLIGDQCWFAENCRHMPTISAPTNLGTSNLDTLPRAFVYGYPGDIISEAESTEEYATYGNMYNWIALEEWEVCPNGWHVPTDSDWQSLESNIGMSAVEVTGIGWMRGHEDGLSMELQNNGFQINSKGGFVHHTLGFLDGDDQAFYWSSTLDNANPSTPGPIFHRRFSEIQEGIYRGSDFNQNSGAYVRCLRD